MGPPLKTSPEQISSGSWRPREQVDELPAERANNLVGVQPRAWPEGHQVAGDYTAALASPPRRPVRVTDGRGFNLSIVGESHYQLSLRRLSDAADIKFISIVGGAAGFTVDDQTYVGTTTPPSEVPEPATLSLLGLGLAGIGARRWRQRKAS